MNVISPSCIFVVLLCLAAPVFGQQPTDTTSREPAPDTLRPPRLEGMVISATRSTRRIEDEPLRVERIGSEEIEEKIMMTPGDITMMLNETAGLRVQTTSPSLGAANVRIQGLRGRYTQILSDGLPLYGGQTGGLGLLQIPPMDLGSVDIIKGVASALYGGSALGGVIDLASRRPPHAGEPAIRELLINQTSQGGTDLVGFTAASLAKQWGYSFLLGGHRQRQTDRDNDGWTDIAGYERLVARPRLFWRSDAGHSVMLTAGTTIEGRRGGTMAGDTTPAGSGYAERLRTHRYDLGGVAQMLRGTTFYSLRSAATLQQHRHTLGATIERDQHLTWLNEVSMTMERAHGVYVLGAAVQGEQYRARDVLDVDFTFTTPGIFGQATINPHSRFALTASARVDHHSEYGTQFAPRLSTLVRVGSAWTVRVSGGAGYFAPTPFVEETEGVGLTRLIPPSVTGLPLRVERGESGSVDIGGVFDTPLGSLELTATGFGSLIRHPVGVKAAASDSARFELLNLDGPARTAGAELLATLHPEGWHIVTSYTYMHATEPDPASTMRRLIPLTPRQQASMVIMRESATRRIGFETYYTGRQSLDDNPYRTSSKPYVIFGLLVEQRVGPARLFVNFENLTNVRQTRTDRLVRPSPGLGGRWTTDVWSSLEGRVVNGGVRWEFGGQRGHGFSVLTQRLLNVL